MLQKKNEYYIPPTIKEVEFYVERGFAGSFVGNARQVEALLYMDFECESTSRNEQFQDAGWNYDWNDEEEGL